MREYFHVPKTYFLSHSVGCLPIQSEQVLTDRFIGPWTSGENWSLWMGELEEFRRGLGRLLGVSPENICPQVNISSALTKILFSLPKTKGRDVLLLSRQDFPTIGFVAKQAQRLGYRLKFIDSDDPCDFSPWKAALDSSVTFVLATHALSNSSHLLPVAQICAAARRVGAISIVDIAQSFGAVTVDVLDWQPDFLIGTGVKFLCFGPGACFLYAAPHMLPECQPLDVGWFSHENPFEMDIDDFRYANDAMRFFGGTPSPASYVLANSAIGLWTSLTLENAHGVIQKHIASLCEAVPETFIMSPRLPDKRGATFVLAKSAGDKIKSVLEGENILFDQRNDGYRFSVHGYTSAEDINTLAAILSKAT